MRRWFGLSLISLLFLWGCAEDADPTRVNTFVPLTAITIVSQYPQIANLTTNQFTAIGDFSGMFTRDLTEEVTWESLHPQILQISNAPGTRGLATAISPGQATVVASLEGVEERIEFTVTEAFIVAMAVQPATASRPRGLTQAFTAEGTFSNNTVQDLTLLSVWTAEDVSIVDPADPAVARIDQPGLAMALAPGVTTIRATFENVSGTALLTVTDAEIQTISLTPGEDTVVEPGETLQFQAVGRYSDDTSPDITDVVLWMSSNPQVAEISAGGLVTAGLPGTTTITAELDGILASLNLSVAVLESISITTANGQTANVVVGGTLQLEATGNYNGGLTRDLTEQAEWSSDPIGIAIVGNTSGNKGRVTGIAPGTATITVNKDEAVEGNIGIQVVQ